MFASQLYLISLDDNIGFHKSEGVIVSYCKIAKKKDEHTQIALLVFIRNIKFDQTYIVLRGRAKLNDKTLLC